jgi:hypothetical protein
VILPGVNLSDQAAHAGPVRAHQHEEILDDEAAARVVVDHLDVGEPLPIRAHLVLALHDEDAAGAEDAQRLMPGLRVEFQDGLVIPPGEAVPGRIVGVVILVVLVSDVGRAPGRVHVGRIEDESVQRGRRVREAPAIHPRLQVGGEELVRPPGDLLPEDPVAVGHVGDLASRSDVEPQHQGKHGVVGAPVCREDEVVRRGSGR